MRQEHIWGNIKMAKKTSTKDSAKVLEALWEDWNESQKRAILKATGSSTSFAKTKTIREMVGRGGGMVAKDLHRLVKEHKKRNPGVKTLITG